MTKQPRIHDLRHTHCSWLLAAGVPVHVVSRRLGHESIITTVHRYGSLVPGAEDQVLAVLDAMGGPTAPLPAIGAHGRHDPLGPRRE